MKTKIKIAIVAMIGFNLGMKAQWNSSGNNSTTGILTMDGYYINFNAPITSGGWARGSFNVASDKTTRIGGMGLLGSGNTPVHYYIAHGNSPWDSGLGLYIKSNGNVGIGTVTPNAKLDVRGDISITGSEQAVDSYISELKFINFYTTTSPMASIGVKTRKEGSAPYNYSNLIFNTSNGYNTLSEKMRITESGNVGIGTTTTGSHKLAVEGSIGAREIKVEGSGWSDFVFENTYNLPSLQEVEAHIKEKGHLKDIPSAKEVEENGFYLGAMDAKLLQKIEELTLYTIEQEKKLQSQDEKIELLKGQQVRIEKLEKENKTLKTLLEKVNRLEKLIEEK